jgi:hypothetical protein
MSGSSWNNPIWVNVRGDVFVVLNHDGYYSSLAYWRSDTGPPGRIVNDAGRILFTNRKLCMMRLK